MRAFLAFDVSPEVTGRMEAAEGELKKTGADVGLVSRENLHFTVKFLGEISESDVRVVDDRVGKLELSAFDVMVKGIGVFPDLHRPSVVWAGVDAADEEPISRRGGAVLGALDGVGKPEEREFRPHITIARVRSPRNLDSIVSFVRENAAREFGRTRIASLKLKSSLLTPKGPVYSDLREYVFK
ncbi:MAG: RNA 2',3'-cyclic phosphodiesterase [Nitrososphaerota archaeon]|jgi:2'-5' RNA ligase|nr:RNA 2',3'-cyclic phosphodiesterase [Nitrososphaerota archaeon]